MSILLRIICWIRESHDFIIVKNDSYYAPAAISRRLNSLISDDDCRSWFSLQCRLCDKTTSLDHDMM